MESLLLTYIEAPNYQSVPKGVSAIFLAGGITGCPDWQDEAVAIMRQSSKHVAVFNPRREDFPIHDPAAAEKQIKWEFHYLRQADIVLFWFAEKEIQPIALYELGAWSKDHTKQIVIGVHAEYPRLQDVYIQTKLVRPGTTIWPTLPLTVNAALGLA